MQLSIGNLNVRKLKPIEGGRVTEREKQILIFVLQMKFASLEDIHFKFFTRLQSGETSRSLKYTYERIVFLKKLGFLKSMKHPRHWSSVLFPTWKAYYFVRDVYHASELPKPSRTIDLNTFDHDAFLLKLRLQLETELKVSSWISDRTLRSFPELTGGLTGHFVPDGIYQLPNGTKVAFELEIALKAKDKYSEKIKKYLYLLKSQKSPEPFSKVHFVYAKDAVRKHLENETKLYPEFFRLEPLTTYLNPQLNSSQK